MIATKVRPEEPVFYIAISHVWSDGLGNPTENAMPLCQLRRINSILQVLPGIPSSSNGGVPFWIDTLCCPAINSPAKRLAITRMRETYASADSTFVLSADLQAIEASQLPTIDLAYLVSLSSWASRLWTLQEGALSRLVYVMFNDIVLDFSEVLEDCLGHHKSTFARGWINYGDYIRMWAIVRGDEFDDSLPALAPVFSLENAMIAVTHRTTSVTSDEALCLGSLVGADLGRIAGAAPPERMWEFWTSVPKIPWTTVLWRRERMAQPGRRWAPRSLLGVTDAVDFFSDRAAGGECTPEGLVVEAPGMILQSLVPPFRTDIYFRLYVEDCNGREQYCFYKECVGERADAARFAVPNGEFSQIAIVADDTSVTGTKNFTMLFIYKVEGDITFARRGDAGYVQKKSSSLASTFADTEKELQSRRDDPTIAEGDEYLREMEGHIVCFAARGKWDEEPRKWCID
ncbi:hypothetical protein DBV05_g7943 [Lasiodiplodia theobromae]|nr:hypothetical protein DBV05_g7943 [Lasiodiplodia theobromae]